MAVFTQLLSQGSVGLHCLGPYTKAACPYVNTEGGSTGDALGGAVGSADGAAVGAPLGDEDELGWNVGVPLGAGLGWVPGAQVVTHGS